MTYVCNTTVSVCCSANVVRHKTFHRYVVRAKRGTCQSSHDSKGGHAPKSAGASLRRYNEAALTQVAVTVIFQALLVRNKCDFRPELF